MKKDKIEHKIIEKKDYFNYFIFNSILRIIFFTLIGSLAFLAGFMCYLSEFPFYIAFGVVLIIIFYANYEFNNLELDIEVFKKKEVVHIIK